MKNSPLILIAIILLTGLTPMVFGQQQKTGIVFNRFLLPAMVSDTSKMRTEEAPVRLQDADLPKDGTLRREKNGALRLEQATPAPEHKPVQKTDKAQQ